MMFEYKQPQFFPLNDTRSSYTITQDRDGFYYVNYSGKSAFNINKVLIGKSDVDLAAHVEKPEKVKGEFVSAKQQCIVQQCTELAGPHVVLDIASVTEK